MRASHDKLKRLIDSIKNRLKIETNDAVRASLAQRGIKLNHKMLQLTPGEETDFRKCTRCCLYKPIGSFEKYKRVRKNKYGYRIRFMYYRIACKSCAPYRKPKRAYKKKHSDVMRIGKLQTY